MFDFLKMAIWGADEKDSEAVSGNKDRNYEVTVSGSLSGTYQVNGCDNWLEAAILVQEDIDQKHGKQSHIKLNTKEN